MTRIDAHANDILINWNQITADLCYSHWYLNQPPNVADFGKELNGNRFFYLTDDVDEDTKLWIDMCHISNAMSSANMSETKIEHMLVTLTYENDYAYTYHMTFHVGLPIVHVLGHGDENECVMYVTYMLTDGELVRNRIL